MLSRVINDTLFHLIDCFVVKELCESLQWRQLLYYLKIFMWMLSRESIVTIELNDTDQRFVRVCFVDAK